jgi:hypothetical protein
MLQTATMGVGVETITGYARHDDWCLQHDSDQNRRRPESKRKPRRAPN